MVTCKTFCRKTRWTKIHLGAHEYAVLSISLEDTLKRFAREITKTAEFNAFHDKVNTLPLSGEMRLFQYSDLLWVWIVV